MKGPYQRLKYDLRRVWECPECHHRERTPGTVTTCSCRCQRQKKVSERVTMKLVEDGLRVIRDNPTSSRTHEKAQTTDDNPRPKKKHKTSEGNTPSKNDNTGS